MIVGIFFTQDTKNKISQLLDKIKEIPEVSNVRSYQIGTGWEYIDGGELKYILSQLSHIVIYYSDSFFQSRWIGYLNGYCAGSNCGLSIYVKEKAIEFKPYLNLAKQEASLSKLIRYIENDIRIRYQVNAIEEAREYLVNHGYGLNENSLGQAVTDGNLELVEQYIRSGFSPNSVDDKGVPLLNYAVRNERDEIFDFLIDRNADVNLVAQDRGNSALMDACVTGKKDSVRILLERGADTEIKSKNGQTALMIAIGENHLSAVKMLIKYKADPNVTDSLGMNAIKYAKLFKNKKIIAALEAVLPTQS